MDENRIMKRIAAILAAILVPAAGYFLLVSTLVSVDAARDHATGQLAAWTGRKVSASEQAELHLFPAPSLILHDLRVGGLGGEDDADLLSAKTLQADIRILPLLIGRISLSTLTLSEAHIELLRNPKGRRNWRFDGGPAAVQLAISGDLPFDRFVLRNATVSYDNIRRQIRETALIPDLTLDWESIGQPATLSGSVQMRDEALAFRIRVGNPPAFFDRKSTGFSAELKSEMLNARLEGELADYKAVRFVGQLDASAPSLRRIITFSGGPQSIGPGLGAIAISGQANLTPDKLFIDRGKVQLDDNTATGNLSVAFPEKTGRPKLMGTLAFATLNLTPYLQALGGSPSAGWNDRRVDTDWFDKLNADIRLSAEKIIAGHYTFGGTAASAFLKDNVLEFGLAQSMFYNGVVSGSISVADLEGAAGQSVDVQLRATEFNFGQTFRIAENAPDPSGTATMSIDVETRGVSLGEQLDNLAGTVSVISLDGGAPDLGLGAALDALLANSPLNGVSRGGISFYQRLKISGTLGGGRLSLDDLVVAANNYSASLRGSLDLKSLEIDLAGSMSTTQPGERRGTVEIRGSVSGPVITLTPDGS